MPVKGSFWNRPLPSIWRDIWWIERTVSSHWSSQGRVSWLADGWEAGAFAGADAFAVSVGTEEADWFRAGPGEDSSRFSRGEEPLGSWGADWRLFDASPVWFAPAGVRGPTHQTSSPLPTKAPPIAAAAAHRRHRFSEILRTSQFCRQPGLGDGPLELSRGGFQAGSGKVCSAESNSWPKARQTRCHSASSASSLRGSWTGGPAPGSPEKVAASSLF